VSRASWCIPVLLVAWLAFGPARAAVAQSPPNTCLDCHRQDDPDRFRNFNQDIHAVRGLGCVGCHGGNPNDPDLTAMDPDKGFRGAPTHQEIAPLCASCHANAAYMKQFNPKPYIFSMAEFRTSVHGKLDLKGDTKVATCINCHGVHGILPHTDPRSPVFKKNVPGTCAHCHNPEYMKGRGIPTNQHALYVQSVHGRALLENGDLSAPACNDCHGNHGAAPPDTRDISHVCGNCHGREGELFASSPVAHRMEREGKRGCVTCHGNHGVEHPTDAMISSGPEGVCGSCHTPGSPGEKAAARIVPAFHDLKQRIEDADSLIARAAVLGMETSGGEESVRLAQDQVVSARVVLHSFDPGKIDTVIAQGVAHADDAAASAEDALRDWRVRRIGMGLSLVMILVLMGLVIGRIRSIEKPETRKA